MKLDDRVIEGLAAMVSGNHKEFPYRKGWEIGNFFNNCGFLFQSDNSSREPWTQKCLAQINLGPASSADLPSDGLVRVIPELLDPVDFDRHNDRIDGSMSYAEDPSLYPERALAAFNKLVARHGLVAYFDPSGRCHIRNTGTGYSSASSPQQPRPLSKEEIEQREKLEEFLEGASEDEFTERVLVPLFQRLGFHRVSAAGHKEKTLEFGKDLWMKYQLPTGHWIYFCAQVKRDKIDSAGSSGGDNVSTVLTQARMAIDHPIFDPDTNREMLLDHIFIISAGEITRAAKTWIAGKLDKEQRRHFIFMDRSELLDHSARILLDLRIDPLPAPIDDSEIPF